MLNDLPLKHSLSRMDDCPSIWGESIKWRHIKMWHMLIWSVICVIVVNLLQSIVGCQVYEKQKLMSPRARNSPVSCRQKRISLNRSTRLEVLVNRVLAVKSDLDLTDHLWCFMVYNFSQFYLSLFMYVCQTITLKRLDAGNSYLHIWCISRQYGQFHIWRSSGQGQSYRSKVDSAYSCSVKLHAKTTPLLRRLKIPSPITVGARKHGQEGHLSILEML